MHIAFVCEHDRQLVATVGITLFEIMPTTKYPNGRVARLMNMYVEPSYRHQGIAKKLLDYVMMYAKEHRIGKVMLNPSQMGKVTAHRKQRNLQSGSCGVRINS